LSQTASYDVASNICQTLDMGASAGAPKDAERVRLEKAGALFDEVLDSEGGARELEALMGRVKILETSGQVAGAIEVLNHVVVQFAWFVPAMVRRCRLTLSNPR
jgi:hypothetical protein